MFPALSISPAGFTFLKILLNHKQNRVLNRLWMMFLFIFPPRAEHFWNVYLWVSFLAVLNTRIWRPNPLFTVTPTLFPQILDFPYFPKPRPYFPKSLISRNPRPIVLREMGVSMDLVKPVGFKKKGNKLYSLDSEVRWFAAPQARKILGFLQPIRKDF